MHRLHVRFLSISRSETAKLRVLSTGLIRLRMAHYAGVRAQASITKRLKLLMND